jgi:hypothetical protein
MELSGNALDTDSEGAWFEPGLCQRLERLEL